MVDPQPTNYSVTVLIDEFKSDEISRRVNSVTHLAQIAKALGQERTRNELLPFLTELLDDEEEVLAHLAKSLPSLVEPVGGPAHAHTLFDLLEELCQIEDASVRQSAAASLVAVLQQAEPIEARVLDLMTRLTKHEWHEVQVVAAQVTPAAIERLSEQGQSELLELYKSLVHSETVVVRKAAAENLAQLKAVSRFDNKLIDMLGSVAVDRDDSVKLLTVENLLGFAKTFPAKITSSLLPLLRILLDDSSWRVRYLIANNITELSNLFGPDHKSGLFKPAFVKFLQDQEPEVKTAACTKLAEFSATLSPAEVVANIVPVLPALSKEVDYVRAAFTSNLPKLCVHLGRNATNEYLMPMILELLRDESADIKMCLFQDLECIGTVIGAENLAQSIMPTLNDLANHSSWRVREQLMEVLSTLATQMGQEFFETHLQSVLLKMFEDSVYSVRAQAIASCKQLVEAFGEEWFSHKLMDAILETSSVYSKRITAALALKELATLLSERYICAKVVPALSQLSTDAVPNVRLNIATCCSKVYKELTENRAKLEVKAILAALTKDEDLEVKFSAEQALKVCG